MADTIVKGDLTRIFQAKYGLIWLSGLRGEDLHLKGLIRTTDDGHQVMTKAHAAFGQMS